VFGNDYYGLAPVSRIDKIIGLFCKRAQLKRRYSAKETCNSIDPTDRSHPIVVFGTLGNTMAMACCSVLQCVAVRRMAHWVHGWMERA